MGTLFSTTNKTTATATANTPSAAKQVQAAQVKSEKEEKKIEAEAIQHIEKEIAKEDEAEQLLATAAAKAEEEARKKKADEDLAKAKAAEEARKAEEERVKAEAARVALKKAQDELAAAKAEEDRIKALAEAKRLSYNNAAQLICAIYHNYQFPSTRTNRDEWLTTVTNIVKNYLTVESFWIICNIPHVLPAIWPTGSGDASFHNYPMNSTTNKIDVSAYLTFLNTPNAAIATYVKANLVTYIVNICDSNFENTAVVDQTKIGTIHTKCGLYITNAEKSNTDLEWMTNTLRFIQDVNDEDMMHWKTLAAKTRKGYCDKQIRLVPSTFPKISPKYEAFECLLMLTNSVINQYGSLRSTKDELMIKSNETLKDYTNGGKCFEHKQYWLKRSYVKFFDNKLVWDRKTFISIHELEINVEEIIGRESTTNDWMSEISTHPETEVFMKTADINNPGYYKYVNPTQKYTSQFINDKPMIQVTLKIPILSAEINEKFKTRAIIDMFETLTGTGSEYQIFNVYAHMNRNLFSSIDYLNYSTKDFENISLLARYVFMALIQNSCKWSLVVPLEESMNFHKINANIPNKIFYPQLIWTKVEGVNDTLYKVEEKKAVVVTPTYVPPVYPLDNMVVV
jgi:hypothetical protein